MNLYPNINGSHRKTTTDAVLTQSAGQSQSVSTQPLTAAQIWGGSDRKRKYKPVVRTINAT